MAATTLKQQQQRSQSNYDEVDEDKQENLAQIELPIELCQSSASIVSIIIRFGLTWLDDVVLWLAVWCTRISSAAAAAAAMNHTTKFTLNRVLLNVDQKLFRTMTTTTRNIRMVYTTKISPKRKARNRIKLIIFELFPLDICFGG